MLKRAPMASPAVRPHGLPSGSLLSKAAGSRRSSLPSIVGRRQTVEVLCQATKVAVKPRSSFAMSSVDMNVGNASKSELNKVWSKGWEGVPSKTKLTLAACAAFAISNMDKVNISIAVIPMTQEFGWTPATTGLIQSAFFLGSLAMQLPGGYLASKFGGRRVLPIGLATWSAATAIVPLMASTLPTMCLSRSFVGFGEAVAPTAIVDIIARTVKKEERASAVSFAFTGLHIGSIIGLLASSLLISNLGWRAVFYVFGGAGLFWYAWWESIMAEISAKDPDLARKMEPGGGAPAAKAAEGAVAAPKAPQQAIPYRAFVRNPALWTLCFTHFCNNWFHWTMLSWMPTYFTDVLGLHDLTHTATASLVPPLAGVVCSLAAGPVADKLISNGWEIAPVRKLMQSIAFMGPVVFMLLAAHPPGDTVDPIYTTGMISFALGLSSFSLAGLYCTHQDMSPKYAGALLGVTNVAGAISGIMGVSAVGLLFDAFHSWDAALFLPNILLMVAGTAGYCLFGKNEPIDFDMQDNSPLPGEWIFDGPKKALAALKEAITGEKAPPEVPTVAGAPALASMGAGARSVVGASMSDMQPLRKPMLVSYFTMASIVDFDNMSDSESDVDELESDADDEAMREFEEAEDVVRAFLAQQQNGPGGLKLPPPPPSGGEVPGMPGFKMPDLPPMPTGQEVGKKE